MRQKSPDLVRELYEVSRLLHAEATPDEPRVPLEQALAAACNVPAVYDGATIVARSESGDIVGFADVLTQDMEGYRHVAQVNIGVLPEHRRAGVARTLLGSAVDFAERLGRTLLMGSTRDTIPAGEAFAQRIGAELGQVITENRLDLRMVDPALVRSWTEAGATGPPGYHLELVKATTPEHLLPGVIAAFEILNTAPRDDLQVGDFTITAERLKDEEAAAAAAGMERWAYYAVEDSSSHFVGITDIVVNPGTPERIHVGNTAVAPGHRGHALGKWLKGAMTQKILDELPAARWLVTSNAASNEAMLSINAQLGFRARAAVKTWQLSTERTHQYLSGQA